MSVGRSVPYCELSGGRSEFKEGVTLPSKGIHDPPG